MEERSDEHAASTRVTAETHLGWLRVVVAGALMGWANLVPGVSGGTMLLVCGVYPEFVAAVSDLTRFRWRPAVLRWVAILGLGAVAAILSSAGVIKTLVETYPVAMYSFFAGLTLGGVPLVLRRAAPPRPSPSVWVAGATAFAAMMALAWVDREGPVETGPLHLFVAGGVGASAMVLPGLSGSYLLLLLGQYLHVLGAIEEVRRTALDPLIHGQAVAWGPAVDAAADLLPFGLGVGLGVVAVSQIVRIALRRAAAPTYGLLLGLLLGAVPGLWPFRTVPSASEAGWALLCFGAGVLLTWALSQLDRRETGPPI